MIHASFYVLLHLILSDLAELYDFADSDIVRQMKMLFFPIEEMCALSVL